MAKYEVHRRNCKYPEVEPESSLYDTVDSLEEAQKLFEYFQRDYNDVWVDAIRDNGRKCHDFII